MQFLFQKSSSDDQISKNKQKSDLIVGKTTFSSIISLGNVSNKSNFIHSIFKRCSSLNITQKVNIFSFETFLSIYSIQYTGEIIEEKYYFLPQDFSDGTIVNTIDFIDHKILPEDRNIGTLSCLTNFDPISYGTSTSSLQLKERDPYSSVRPLMDAKLS